MITFGIFFITLLGFLLYRIHKITNEPFTDEQNKEKYRYLFEEIRSKMGQIEECMHEHSKKGEIEESTDLSAKYNEFFNNHLRGIMSPFFLDKEYPKDGKTNYPIKKMRTALKMFTIEFPEVFKRENRDRKIDSLLGE